VPDFFSFKKQPPLGNRSFAFPHDAGHFFGQALRLPFNATMLAGQPQGIAPTTQGYHYMHLCITMRADLGIETDPMNN